MPRLTSTGFAPAPIACMPYLMMPWASTVAVVVPSPTMSLVLIAASLTSWAPMFSNWFGRWISRAIVTPSLVTTGDPVIFSRMTLRPLGPSVDLTASASLSTPASSRLRASSPKRSSLAIDHPPASGSEQWGRVSDSDQSVSDRKLGPDRKLGNEDGAAADPAGVAVGEGLRRGIQRIGPGVQGDLAVLREDHELRQLVVGADDVPDNVPLGRDDVEGRDVHRAAVADDVVRAGRARHREPVLLGALLGDEVQHHVGPGSAGRLLPRRSPRSPRRWCRGRAAGWPCGPRGRQ